ncbi:Uncharacterised protein [Mycobacteroides abscessus subsp. abscessus]|nr:Uncharacterised protein [Mycobacteroides abscessus subsp. abscessus]
MVRSGSVSKEVGLSTSKTGGVSAGALTTASTGVAGSLRTDATHPEVNAVAAVSVKPTNRCWPRMTWTPSAVRIWLCYPWLPM